MSSLIIKDDIFIYCRLQNENRKIFKTYVYFYVQSFLLKIT